VTELNQAFRTTLAVLANVEPSQLDAPTPCASWDVRALINHFVGTARWWAVTVAGGDEATDADYASGDFVAAYQESIKIAVAAFEAEGALEKMVTLPFGEFPGVVLRGFAALDQFTHGWDLARAIGHHTDLDPGLATGLLSQSRTAITDALRGPDGQAPFGPVREAPAGSGPADQLAAFLGRPVLTGARRRRPGGDAVGIDPPLPDPSVSPAGRHRQPAFPSIRSLIRSACPVCPAYSPIMWMSAQRSDISPQRGFTKISSSARPATARRAASCSATRRCRSRWAVAGLASSKSASGRSSLA
jgi:uncharacterized protein (TIGR03086 family)